jgi:hypothetical protein
MTRCELNGRRYKDFDPEKEWVVLAEWALKGNRIVAYYE